MRGSPYSLTASRLQSSPIGLARARPLHMFRPRPSPLSGMGGMFQVDGIRRAAPRAYGFMAQRWLSCFQFESKNRIAEISRLAYLIVIYCSNERASTQEREHEVHPSGRARAACPCIAFSGHRECHVDKPILSGNPLAYLEGSGSSASIYWKSWYPELR